jgi:branched-chain amino acid transport system permease protein
LTLLPELLRGFGDFRLILYGLALTLVVLFMPGGIAQATRLLRARLRRTPTARDQTRDQ